MISLSAQVFLFDLRVIRRLLTDHNATLSVTEASLLAQQMLDRTIERIEDVTYFLKAIEEAGLPAPSEDGVGEDLGPDPLPGYNGISRPAASGSA